MHFGRFLLLTVGVVVVTLVDGQSTSATTTQQDTTTTNPSTSPITTTGGTSSCPAECLLEMERGGRGKAPFTRYYYDGTHCTRFRYTGRNGNGNKFIRKKECQERCEVEACGDGGGGGGSKDDNSKQEDSDETGAAGQ